MNTEHSYGLQGRKRRWPWVLLVLVLALVVGTQGYRLFLRSKVRHELALIRQEGFPTSPRELQDWRGPVPDTENAALRILEAKDYFAIAPGNFSRWPSRNEELGPEERDEFSEIVTNHEDALEILHDAAQRKNARYPVDYSLGFSMLLPHLAKVKSASQLLRAEALMHTEEGRTQPAVGSLIAGVGLARSLESESLLISQLVRIACLAITGAGLERTLNQHALSEEQLAALATAVQGAREASQKAYREGYVGEMCAGIHAFKMKPGELLKVMNPDSEVSVWAQALFPLYAWSGLRDRDCLFYVRSMRQMLDAAKEPFPASLEEMRSVDQSVEQRMSTDRLSIFSKMLLPAMQRYAQKAAESEARLRCAEAALAIERFRQKNNGALPENLAATASPELVKMLTDPFDGAPLRYEKLRQGYVVYSVGPDAVDDGGMERETGKERGGSRRDSGYDVTFTVDR